jgi:hypothetical protein
MTIEEFVEASNRLESYYGKEYTTDQRQIMYEELKNLSVVRYKKLISQCIRSCKYLPKVVDIYTANTELAGIETKDDDRKIFPCDKCNGTGYVYFTKIIQEGDKVIPYVYSARCICENSKYANSKVPSYKELGIEVSNRINQIKDATRDIDEIRKSLLKKFV